MRVRAAATAALLAVLWLTPLPAEPKFQLCGFHWLTGLPCPLCGLTRGVFALAKGHWSQALHFNALSPLGFIMLFSLIWNGPWRVPLYSIGAAAFGIYGLCRIFS